MPRDLIREYLIYATAEKGLSKNSIDAYTRDLRKFEVWAENQGCELTAIERNDIREYLIDLSSLGINESSKRRLISSLRGFYKFLMFDGHMVSSPAENIDVPRKSNYLPRFLDQFEMNSLLAAPDVTTETGVRDRALIELMYACGLRVSEAVNLRIRDVDTENGILTATGKGSKTRRVPVGTSALSAIEKYLAIRRSRDDVDIDELFVTPGGRPLSRQAVFLLIQEHAERAGLADVSPHTLRHTFATHLVQNGADIRSVQEMLGHADISTTQIYTHITSTQLRKNYDRFHPRSRNP